VQIIYGFRPFMTTFQGIFARTLKILSYISLRLFLMLGHKPDRKESSKLSFSFCRFIVSLGASRRETARAPPNCVTNSLLVKYAGTFPVHSRQIIPANIVQFSHTRLLLVFTETPGKGQLGSGPVEDKEEVVSVSRVLHRCQRLPAEKSDWSRR
jgi:hypothetical protein